MNELLSQILPSTRAMIWFPREEMDKNSVQYKTVDYLCDGVLTSTLETLTTKSSVVLLGKNFGSSLIVFVCKTPVKKEVESFLALVPKEEPGEILVIDENEMMGNLKGLVNADTISKMKRVT